MIDASLERYGSAIIVDCHSYPNEPLSWESPESPVPEPNASSSNNNKSAAAPRLDICIGTDPFHTPAELVKKLTTFFTDKGFSVGINTPFAGTLIPTKYYQKDKRVTGFMIEINRSLFMDEQACRYRQNDIKKMQIVMKELFNNVEYTLKI